MKSNCWLDESLSYINKCSVPAILQAAQLKFLIYYFLICKSLSYIPNLFLCSGEIFHILSMLSSLFVCLRIFLFCISGKACFSVTLSITYLPYLDLYLEMLFCSVMLLASNATFKSPNWSSR